MLLSCCFKIIILIRKIAFFGSMYLLKLKPVGLLPYTSRYFHSKIHNQSKKSFARKLSYRYWDLNDASTIKR